MRGHWYYILQDKIPIPVKGSDAPVDSPEFKQATIVWAAYMADADRTVKQEHIGPYFVSTVFLGVNLALPWREGVPRLFETMVLDKDSALWQERTPAWETALEAHQRAVEWTREQMV